MGRPEFSPRGGGGRGGGGFRGRGGGGDRGGRGGGGRGFRGGGGGGGFRQSNGEGGGGGGGFKRGFGGRGGSPRGGGGGRGGGGSPRGRGGSPRGRGGSPRGGGAGGGMRGGRKVIVEPHRIRGIFIVKGKEDALCTLNMVPGESVYGEKRIASQQTENAPMAITPKVEETTNGSNGVSTPAAAATGPAPPVEYRVWNPFRSKLAAAVMAGIEDTHIYPGARVLYLGAASGTSVSHVSDIVGPEGMVYAVEFSHRSGRDLLGMAKKRPNVVPIVDDARHPHKYSMMIGIVDTIFSDVAQPDQARIVAHNAHKFLKNNGHVVISIKANCVDSTAEPEAVFAGEVNKLREEQFKPIEQVTLEPYERDHAVVVAEYRAAKKKVKKEKKEQMEEE
ncbi:hypothetical protein niasHT_004264 [Heterodera trifolii]|uniref:rRNA 2'-O-methyltransferase fibrillarin n=1 Tax=Heterodera trifolii TaxID=157864 RepID=A0ABD2LND7_9BILA